MDYLMNCTIAHSQKFLANGVPLAILNLLSKSHLRQARTAPVSVGSESAQSSVASALQASAAQA